MAVILLYGFALYVLVGIVAAIAFVVWGVTRVLPQAGAVSPGARILLLPAAAALWPYVLSRWRQAVRPS